MTKRRGKKRRGSRDDLQQTYVKRDLYVHQKRPTYIKRDKHNVTSKSQKRPIYIPKEAYIQIERAIHKSKETYIH